MRIFKQIVIAVCAALAFAASIHAQSPAEGWTKVDPTELKNAVELFANDKTALAVGKEGDLNATTMSWGSIGELWGKPIVTVVVDHIRYTYSLMGLYDYFTITAFPKKMNGALDYISSHSFKEGNLIIECRTIYEAPIDVDNMLDDDIIKMYQDNKLKHTMFVGEIVNVWKR